MLLQSLGKGLKKKSPQTREGSTALNPWLLFPSGCPKSTTETLKVKKNTQPWLLKFQVDLGD